MKMIGYRPRIYYQTIKYSVTCMTMSMILLFSVSFTLQNHSLYHLNPFHSRYERDVPFTNQSIASSLTYQIETTEFDPYLPIQIFTENRERFLQLKDPRKQVILIATPFFDDPTWTMNSLRTKTNGGNMSELFCSFLSNHCEITTDLERFSQADAVVYHLRNHLNESNMFTNQRRASQRYVFTLWEPPVNTPDLRSFNQFFNWSMTYRFDSHIFASYYLHSAYRLRKDHWLQTHHADIRSNEEKVLLWKNINLTKKRGTAAALISNCGTASEKRWSLILELQKYIDVTIYGHCGRPCPKSNTSQPIDCREYLAEHYYFLLAFENSYCQDYTTEKLFTTLTLPIVPVVFGQIDYIRYVPRTAVIDSQEFPSMGDLANRLIEVKNSPTLYGNYFHWKKDFLWGGFAHFMTPFCDLCLRLHLDRTPHIIDNVHQWWFDQTCEPEVTKYF